MWSKAKAAVGRGIRGLWRLVVAVTVWVIEQISAEDVAVALGIGLIAAGVWLLSPPAALIIAGAIIVWWALPPRPPFIVRPGVSDPPRGDK